VTPNWPGGPPPGWYPDPAGLKAWRWWDGYSWTQFASDPSGPPGPSTAPGPGFTGAPVAGGVTPGGIMVPSVHDRFAAEMKAGPWAKRVLVGYLAVIVVAILVAWADSSKFRAIFHALQVQVRTGVVQNETDQAGDVNLYSFGLLALEAPFYVLLLMWQFQAARTAQLLFLPARRSPGLGVGSWFIPVVAIWFPYQAIRDCLPPGDPGRSAVARMWGLWIATTVMLGATSIVATFGNPAGFVLAAVTLVLGAGFAFQGTRVVQAVADSHRRLLFPGPPGQTGPTPAVGP
jgi:Domain of unknown function (DUF4328)/Protein of unknown function (DUF2510)